MKDEHLNGLLIEARPKGYISNHVFTDQVMNSLQPPAIFTRQIRKMNVNKKETFIMKFKHLPKFALVAIVLAALAVTGGTTYALYKALWEQPSVTVNESTTNQFGRTQVVASFKNCSNQSDQTTFEIKRGSTLDPSEIGKILQARCEIEALREWSGANKFPGGPDPSIREAEGTSSTVMVTVSPVASKIVSLDSTKLMLTGDEYNTPKEPLVLTSETQYIVEGQQVSAEVIKPGDNILYLTDQTNTFVTKKVDNGYDTTSSVTKEVTTGVIKVDLPLEYYGTGKQNQIAEREPCMNNRQDSCLRTSAIVLYEDFSGSLQGFDDPNNLIKEYRDIQGILIEHTAEVVKIQSSSGRIFTLTTPSDIITDYNQNQSANHNGIKVELGDLLMVHYIVDKTDDGLSPEGLEINSIYVGLNNIQKGGPVQKY